MAGLPSSADPGVCPQVLEAGVLQSISPEERRRQEVSRASVGPGAEGGGTGVGVRALSHRGRLGAGLGSAPACGVCGAAGGSQQLWDWAA